MNASKPPSTAIRFLISYVTAGAGHRRAAEAIAEALRERYPDADVRCIDVLTYAPGWFARFYAWSYLVLVRHLSWVWKFSYAGLDWGPLYRCIQPLRRRWNLFIVRRFVTLLKARPPDGVIATHFLPADVCSAGRSAGWLSAPLIVVITDLYPHRFWISKEADAVVISTAEGRSALRRGGVLEQRIHVQGIPIGKAFSAPADRDALRARWRLKPDRLTVLVTSGGTTVGRFERVVEDLLALESALPGRLQLLVVCGHDERARLRLTRRAERSAAPMHVFGFIHYMAELMAVSDLIVAKAGGLTVSEALGRGLPLILYHVIPGQERMNAEYVARHGAAVIAPRPADVARAVQRCAQEPARVKAMARAARAWGRPDAAETIVSQVIGPLLPPGPDA
ncbi:MAG: glycosyltransferase [Candidatus Omnitrophica bacterium]|nr:glycosyltransferase [Candidatus Omnitrophota bacterium]